MALTNTEKAVTWGLLGLIAWELWQGARPSMGGSSDIPTFGDDIPEWVKQLSRNENKVDFFRRTGGFWGAC